MTPVQFFLRRLPGFQLGHSLGPHLRPCACLPSFVGKQFFEEEMRNDDSLHTHLNLNSAVALSRICRDWRALILMCFYETR
jgi:hypothetical protein